MSHIGKGYDINQTFVIESGNGSTPIFSACTGVYTNEIVSCSGDTYIQLGSSVIRFIGDAGVSGSMSATTYYGDGSNLTGILIQDVFVTGGTYNTTSGIATFTNNTGGTFTVSGFNTEFSGGVVTGATQFIGGLSANTFSATTYLGLPLDIRVTGGTYSDTSGLLSLTNNTGGTFTVNGFYTGYTLTVNEIISVLGYTPLSAYTDTFVTGGTYTNGSVLFTNNTGGTFSVNGFYTGGTDVFVTGGTYSSGVATFTNNTGGTFTVSGFNTTNNTSFTGGTVSGDTQFLNNLSANTLSATTYLGLPLDIRVTGGTKTDDVLSLTNNTGGTFNISGFTDVFVTGGTYSNGVTIFTNNTGGTFNINGYYIGFTGGTVFGGVVFLNGLTATTVSATTYFNLPYWTSGSTGLYSVKTINDTSTDATGNYAFAEGSDTTASGIASHAEGQSTTSSGTASHSEGSLTIAGGVASHAEGRQTTATGLAAHSEGRLTTASGQYSHAEGYLTVASGQYSHSEGNLTTASGEHSHVSGYLSITNGHNSFVHGSASTANGVSTIVLGSNITGNTDNTTYVDKLNIKTVPSGTLVNNLGVDASGNVIIGASSSGSSGTDVFITGGTFSAGTAVYTNTTGGTFSVTGFSDTLIIKSTTTSSSITGVASVVTLVDSVLIPANTFQVGDIIRIRQRGRKTGAANSTSTIYVNTSNTVTGASLLGTFTTVNSNNLFIQMKRDFYIKSSTVTEGFNASLTSATDEASVASSVTSTNIDWTQDQYIIFAVNPAAVGNTYVVSGYIIERL